MKTFTSFALLAAAVSAIEIKSTERKGDNLPSQAECVRIAELTTANGGCDALVWDAEFEAKAMALPEAPDSADLNAFQMGVWVCASGVADQCRNESDLGACVFSKLP